MLKFLFILEFGVIFADLEHPEAIGVQYRPDVCIIVVKFDYLGDEDLYGI